MKIENKKVENTELSKILMNLKEITVNIFGDKLISMILFGSYARRNFKENSDIDLLIITNKNIDFDLSSLRKLSLLNFGKKVDLHIFSKEDVLKNLKNLSPMFVTLLLGNKILYDKERFFETALENFVERVSDTQIKYCEGGKIWEMQKIARNLKILQ